MGGDALAEGRLQAKGRFSTVQRVGTSNPSDAQGSIVYLKSHTVKNPFILHVAQHC